VHVLKGLALPRASHYGEIVLAGSCRLRSTLAVAPVLSAHAVVTVARIGKIITPGQTMWLVFAADTLWQASPSSLARFTFSILPGGSVNCLSASLSGVTHSNDVLACAEALLTGPLCTRKQRVDLLCVACPHKPAVVDAVVFSFAAIAGALFYCLFVGVRASTAVTICFLHLAVTKSVHEKAWLAANVARRRCERLARARASRSDTHAAAPGLFAHAYAHEYMGKT
jgi:hypothetical protein